MSFAPIPAPGLFSDALALIPFAGGAVVSTADGNTRRIGLEEARKLFRAGGVLVAHAAFVSGRLKTPPSAPLADVLELFAFVRPAQYCVPSPRGLARALGLPWPETDEDAARTLHTAARQLMEELRGQDARMRAGLAPLAANLVAAGWRWAPQIAEILGAAEAPKSPIAGFEVWRELKHWEDEPDPGKPGSEPVGTQESQARLAASIGPSGEERAEQVAYLDAALYAFAPRERVGAPKIALVEAGTGVGKTLGYLAPATLWSEKNGPGLWISTYTRNLQRQISQELARFYPDPAERDEKVVVRKGRENYLCLLNFEEAVRRTALAPGQRTVALALMARWISSTSDGDISGSGFPAFLAASIPLREITDRRGECIYAACPHYRSCFIERVIRRARTAPIVIANHALVIAQATREAYAIDETTDVPPDRHLRYVLDEGHHLFDAADSGFAMFLSGVEMTDLRRWIRGPEGRFRSRMRGLEERLKDLILDDGEARNAMEEAVAASAALPADGWISRLHGGTGHGAGEQFLAAVYSQVQARNSAEETAYSLEADLHPLNAELGPRSHHLAVSITAIMKPLRSLASRLRKQMDERADELETAQRGRLEAAARGLERRARVILPTWIAMLHALEHDTRTEEFVDWLEIVRDDGRDMDVGMRRHWIDPTIPFVSDILVPSHGALVTSATLRDVTDVEDWASADIRTGANHLNEPARRSSFGSPFNYAEQSRIFIVRDVERRDMDQLGAAFRELFLASGGGALGLFTAVRTLRAVERRIANVLADAGIALYAQHVDRLDTGTLVDLFRSEENSCLLGTDALRDGVDVPGRSLRLAVFDKIPWPKPTILHKARRARFGRVFDEQLTRLRLKQAFGRLIRTRRDRGCFVILEPRTPTRLLAAFPADAPVKRCGLADAIEEIREFLGESR